MSQRPDFKSVINIWDGTIVAGFLCKEAEGSNQVTLRDSEFDASLFIVEQIRV